MTIIFYDISSALPQKGFSPNTLKTRFCLNYKRIPYKTEWLEFPEIETTCKKLGVGPIAYNADGSPFYTLPLIHDPSTGVSMADSFAIAEYLEKTYPSPSLFPHGTIALQSLFDDALRTAAIRPIFKIVLYDIFSILNPASQPFFRSTREKNLGQALEDIAPKGDDAIAGWEKAKAGLGTVDTWYKKTNGPFLMGETVSWVDLVAASWLIWFKIIKPEKWKEIETWHDGRWTKVLRDLEQYTAIV